MFIMPLSRRTVLLFLSFFFLVVPLSVKHGLWRRRRGDSCKTLGRAARHGALEFGHVDGATDTLRYIQDLKRSVRWVKAKIIF